MNYSRLAVIRDNNTKEESEKILAEWEKDMAKLEREDELNYL